MLCPASTKYSSSDIGTISGGKVLPKLTTQNRIELYKFLNTYAVNVNTGSIITKSFLIISPISCQKIKPCFHVLLYTLWGKDGHWTQQCHISYLNTVPLTTSDCFKQVLQTTVSCLMDGSVTACMTTLNCWHPWTAPTLLMLFTKGLVKFTLSMPWRNTGGAEVQLH
jgi:hypothetical protein